MSKKIILILTLAMFLTGCATTLLVDNSAPLSVQATSALEADVSVGQRISGTGSCMYLFNFIPLKMQSHATVGLVSPSWWELMTGNYNISKHQAAYNAVKDNNADVLVDPSYEMQYTNFFLFGTEKCVVNGYKGTVEGFRNVDSKNVMTIKDSRN